MTDKFEGRTTAGVIANMRRWMDAAREVDALFPGSHKSGKAAMYAAICETSLRHFAEAEGYTLVRRKSR